ncbi:hypothetical protein OG601_47230 [Streptomyces sp. NBC_01239]|uniref:hypothetical protein n=1 Tax=Streptomyces sp. NBC_01239 TaxID=2903792 RepID=UPI00225756D1|nr:hypothetical protein [Streptomyces sp. NBC_01239]MCX4809014.1 hypothetical protein [Streptomyces sp. NBC_01239]MCX4816720.1 hypothetical protein [Streptomyces sp. NBC_01239]MCX4818168.1 hypothetical protein [Streptomyces sp. NBC_01239]
MRKRVDHTPTAPLPVGAVAALARLELAFAPQVVANFDNHGSLWGFDTVAKAEAGIAEDRAAGFPVDEWVTVDRDGQPLRVVRVSDPTFLDTISAFSAWDTSATRAVTA